MDTRTFLEILHTAEKLKDTERHCTTSKRRTESVAEHSWRVSLMALMLKHEFDDLDIDKVIRMSIIHDLGECFTGDIPTFVKTDDDRKTEDILLYNWIGGFPLEIKDEFIALFNEMNAQLTKEGKLFKALDKLEALIPGLRTNMSLTKPMLLIQLLFQTGSQNLEKRSFRIPLKKSVMINNKLSPENKYMLSGDSH